MRRGSLVGASVLVLAAVGCQTTHRGVLTIPVTRDYQELPAVTIDEAAAAVAEARRAGAPSTAPYEYYSAEQYLEMARRQKADRDKAGAQDYAALAKNMAEAALRREPTNKDAEVIPAPASEETAKLAYDDLRERYTQLDAEKARTVAPVLYARVTAGLSRAEYEMAGGKKGWKEAARLFPGIQADLDTIAWQDTDTDGVSDLNDAAPQAPEDMDGFEDEDGVPDLDNDNDGVLDANDQQPTVPETRNGWQDADGAPDQQPQLDSIYFTEGSTSLSPDAQGYLKGLKQMMDQSPAIKLHIKGYADNLHSETYSMELSQRRAQEVQRYLTALGIPSDRIVATYHGQSETGAAPDGNRVDLVLE